MNDESGALDPLESAAPVYADRAEQPLTAADQEAFDLFVSQAALCLKVTAK